MRRTVFQQIGSAVLMLAMVAGPLTVPCDAQVPTPALPPGFGPRYPQNSPVQQPPAQTVPQTASPQGTQPAGVVLTPGAQPAGAVPTPAQTAAVADAKPIIGGLNLQNVNLVEVISFLAQQLKINYILDPRVKGSITLNTYGEVKDVDYRQLLDTILRINGAAMVKTGEIYRIVPLADVARMPLSPEVDATRIPDDDRPMLNLVFLKYANVEELSKLIGDFLGPDGKAWSYAPANLLLILDSRRSMRRTMELISLFDSDALAKQRVRLFEVKHSRPADLARELEDLLKSMSLSKEMSSVRFVPVDRINMLIAVAPNPGVFVQIQEWLDRLDVRVKGSSGRPDTYVYRVKYGKAEVLAVSIMMLYYQLNGGMGMGMGMGMMGMGGYGMGMGGMGFGGMGGGLYGTGMQGYAGSPLGGGLGGMIAGGYGGMTMGYGGMGGGFGATPGGVGPTGAAGAGVQATQQALQSGTNLATLGGGAMDQTGGYMGAGGMQTMKGPRVVPNMQDNSLLILATAEEYESVLRLLRELDLPPRQILIEAKIYEVSLTGAFSAGVSSWLAAKNESGSTSGAPSSRALVSQISSAGLGLTVGALVDQSRQLLLALTASENTSRARVISAPSVMATDSIPATINVGLEVPVLTGQAVTGAQQGGTSLFANTVSNRKTGVTLAITARVNPSGIVTLQVNQEVSAPQAPAVGGIQSPSFSQRTVQTQITVNDGDTIAIGGIINETAGEGVGGVPWLSRLPVVGYAFGTKSKNLQRTELVIFLSPRVIYDTNEMAEASDELVGKMRRLQRLMR